MHPPPPAEAPPPSATEAGRGHDPLLHALAWLTRQHGIERSAASLLADLPITGALRPDQALRVMDAAGFNAGLIERRLADIPSLLMPAVLLLRDGEACVLVRRVGETRGPSAPAGVVIYDVVMPGLECHERQATEAELTARYTGVALVATPRARATSANDANAILRDAGSHWLWGTLRRFAPYYRSALVAALLSNVLMMVSGVVMSVAYDRVIPHQAFATLWALATGAFLALIFDLMARQLRSHLIDMAGRKADLIIGSLLFRQTLGVRLEHRPASAGSFAHHLAQVEIVRDFFASATLSALSDLPFIFLFVAMIFFTGGQLGWVMVIALPLLLGLAAVIQASLRRSTRAHMAHQADLQGVLVEAVEGLEDLKAAGAQGRFLERYETATAAAAESALRSRWMSAWTNNISVVAQQLVSLVMLVWGVYLIHAGHLTGGALIGSIMFASRAVAPLGSVVSLATRYQGARAAMVSLDQLMSLPTEREPGRVYAQRHRLTGRLALHDVNFAYPPQDGQSAPRVLAGVNLRIEPGEQVAILGRIGSGKSTILRLLAGLYQPGDGRVEADGIDLRQIDPADFRSEVGFVSQEPRLFNGSLRENVTMGRAGIDSERLMQVARLTGLDRVVASHPAGWELPVGEMGGLLSGGQRQLVALARCLATQPRILLMDEPTSSMDAQSEVMFLRQLKEAVGDRTLIVVTHRPAVLELARRVIVVDGGKVVIDGPKAQVLAALSGAPAANAPAMTAPVATVASVSTPAAASVSPAPVIPLVSVAPPARQAVSA